MLSNKLFIVCEYIPHSLLQVLEGTAEPLTFQPSAGTSAAQVAMYLFMLSCPVFFCLQDLQARI